MLKLCECIPFMHRCIEEPTPVDYRTEQRRLLHGILNTIENSVVKARTKMHFSIVLKTPRSDILPRIPTNQILILYIFPSIHLSF